MSWVRTHASRGQLSGFSDPCKVALVSGGGKLSIPCQTADRGGLRQGGKARRSSQKQITEGATTEWHSRWRLKPRPLRQQGLASMHRDRLKATAPQGTEMVKQACPKASLLHLTLKGRNKSAKLGS